MMRVARWRGAFVAALAAVAIGVGLPEPALLAVAVVPLVFAAAGYVGRPTAPAVELTRSLAPERPVPGETVTVTLTIEHVGEEPLPDLRFEDGVPSGTPVVEGSATGVTALEPGESTTIEYVVRPRRGTHTFGAVDLEARSLVGTAIEFDRIEPDGGDRVTCVTLLDSVPVADREGQYVGAAQTDTGGEGIEFHGTREYRPGDELSRINWRGFARGRSLTTVTYREERALSVLFVVDDRPSIDVEQAGGGPTATELCAYAASRGLAALIDDGHRAGVVTIDSLSGTIEPDDWVPPGQTAATLSAASEQLSGVGASTLAADGGTTSQGVTASAPPETVASTADAEVTEHATTLARRLAARIDGHTQLVICTPLLDELPVELVERCTGHGIEISLVSPDLISASDETEQTPGTVVAREHRKRRIEAIQHTGTVVTDWSINRPLPVALAETIDPRGGGA
jgi:uncharacterized repeat protein (TIGR01451 family)